MKLLRFLFTARLSFVLFALLAFALTMLYLVWIGHNQRHAVEQHPAALQTR